MRKLAGAVGSAAVLLFVVCSPLEAAGAVIGAMAVWVKSFVPALLPVFIVAPALATDEARTLYRRALSGFSQRAFGIPGEASAALTIGLMAGSPAGALSLCGLKCKKCELCRAGIMASGLSPAFLSAMGGLISSGAVTWQLALTQTLAILSAGWLLRFAWDGDDAIVCLPDPPKSFISGAGMAAVNIAGVLCYMALFQVIAAMLSRIVPGAGRFLAPFLEVASGLPSIVVWQASIEVKLIVAAFVLGLGGLCVAVQNLSRMPFMPPARLLLGKLLHATLAALYLPLILAASGSGGPRIGYSVWPCCVMVVVVFVAVKFNFNRLTRGAHGRII